MSEPTADTFRAIAANQAISLPPELLQVAARQHAALRPQLEELRRVRLSYIELIEPATVSRWIEDGGGKASSA